MTDKLNLFIRYATAEDAAALAQMIDALNRYEGNATGLDVADYAQAVTQWLGDPSHACRFLLAIQNDEPVGYAAFYEGYDMASMTHGVHLGDIYVAESSRRCGIGKALLAQVAASILDTGGEWMSLTMLRNNTAARAFYAGLGSVVADVDFTAFGISALKRMTKK